MIVGSYFDGERLRDEGPYEIEVEAGLVKSIEKTFKPVEFAFATPSFFEAHCHLFLEGEELDAARRSAYLKGGRERMLKVALSNIERYRANGVSGVRDAGDVHGVNLEVRDLAKASGFTVLAAGAGVRKRKRYGSFMAHEVDGLSDIPSAVKRVVESGADVVKIVLTGIIDFENGVVKDKPQFSLEEARLAVRTAHDEGRKAFAHCSGLEGLEIAVEAGVDSIEHGFFMNRSVVERMAEKGVAWCPTFMPVHFQMANPQYCGWSETSVRNLKTILENHKQCLRLAHELGVALLAGSDAGSYGARHGAGLLEELDLLLDAGLPLSAVLKAAVNAPRKLHGLPALALVPGAKAGIVAFKDFRRGERGAGLFKNAGLASLSPSLSRLG